MTSDERKLALTFLGVDESISDDELVELLDEAVHDAKSGEAAEINNSGIQAQLKYLGV